MEQVFLQLHIAVRLNPAILGWPELYVNETTGYLCKVIGNMQ